MNVNTVGFSEPLKQKHYEGGSLELPKTCQEKDGPSEPPSVGGQNQRASK